MNARILKIGHYIKPTWKAPTKGVVYDSHGIAPCMCDYSGGEKYGHESMCIETHSNYESPTIRATANFVVVGIMREDDECEQ